jgi:glutamate-ammonia-ligase adenylyltransferase
LIELLARARTSARYLQLPALSRQRFDALVPQLLTTAATVPVANADPLTVFERLFALLETVSRRSAYLALVIEHPPLLPRLAQLMGASPWAAQQLIAHPILLDELLDARVLLAEPDWEVWRADLARALADAPGDAERQMDALRHFQQAQSFRLLAQDLAGRLTVERLADHLSALADIVLAATLDEVWRHAEGADARPPRFAIVGYGKLGGKELGYASDLDLVFLYDGDDDDAPVRYARLARRLITWLTSTTSAGALYDIDMRLRPDGAPVCRSPRSRASALSARKGVDVGASGAHARALRRGRRSDRRRVRGRARGDRAAAARSAKLATDVVEMRAQCSARPPERDAAVRSEARPGGMVDVEFAVQYLVLAHAHEHPALTRNAGNIALLGMAPISAWSRRPRRAADAYRDYRRVQHQIRLTGAPHARVDPASAIARAAVRRCGATVFGAPGRASAHRLKCHFRCAENTHMSMATAMASSGTTARWCRGATPPRTCSPTRCITDGRVRGRARVPDARRHGDLPPARAHRPAVPLGAHLRHEDPVLEG